MFLGEFTVLMTFFGIQLQQKMSARDPSENVPDEGAEQTSLLGLDSKNDGSSSSASVASSSCSPSASQKTFRPRILFPPACLDLFGTALAAIGLLFTSASVYQMLRGSLLVFTALFSAGFLHRRYSRSQVSGVLLVIVGLILVGLSDLLNENAHRGNSTTQVAFGMACIVLGQLSNGIQFVVEETFVKGRPVVPMQIVGYEGGFGISMMLCIVLPVVYFIPGGDEGSYENAIDSAVMLSNSSFLLVLVLGYLVSIAFYNFFGLSVTKNLTALHRCLIDACRTVLVWAAELYIYYEVSSDYGEPWSSYSFMQLGGFVFLVFGTLIYNKVIIIPCLES
jgi:drug/metabolite transporter (DMT)-like permease